MKLLLYVTGMMLILQFGRCKIAASDYEEPEDGLHPESEKIESGIVFINRGNVLLTGEDWIVAKEFNVTDVVLLVKEAKSLFPSIKKKLESNNRIEGENLWDLQFFRDNINQEIEVIQPIISKIEDKIKIFENMLPGNNDEHSSNLHSRNKRFVWRFLKGIGKWVGRTLFGGGNKEEIEILNSRYNQMLQFQKEQLEESEIRKTHLKYLSRGINELEKEMKSVQNKIASLEVEHEENMKMLNARVDTTIDKVLLLDDKVDHNSKKISKLNNDLNILKIVHERKIHSINQTLQSVKHDVKEVKSTLKLHYTIINDLEVKTDENRRSIRDVKKELANAISNWQKSQKQMTEKLNLVVNITSTMRMMEIKLLSIDTYLTGLLEALDTISTGRLSPNLVSPIQLVEILKDIQDHLPPGVYPLTLIKEDAVYEYYTYATVYAVAIPSAIRVFIKLPLKTPNRVFHLFQPYSLPFYHEDADVYLEISKPSEYVLVSADLLKVAEIPAAVLKECKSKNKMYLCSPTFPLYEDKRCSLSLIRQAEEEIIKSCERSVVIPTFKSKWIRAEGGWIYSVPRISRLTHISHGYDVPQTEIVNGTGFLRDFPNSYTYVDDGTVLFPSQKLGDNRTDAFKEGYIFVPNVPNLLLLNESSKIGESELEDIIYELSKANAHDSEKVNIYHILKHVREALISEAPEKSNGAMVTVLAVAVIVNYAVLGLMCWSTTKKNHIQSRKENCEVSETCD